MIESPNNSTQRMRASRLVQSQVLAPGQLAPTADAARWAVGRFKPS
jgi:hypothetical protein